VGEALVTETPWLFPGDSKRGPVAQLAERSLVPFVGDALRHTYERIAHSINIDAALIDALLAQRRPSGSAAVPFTALLRAQRSISARISELLGLGA
jgi:hypothetical protein